MTDAVAQRFRPTWSLNFYSIGLKYTSASMASAATNSIPVFTFFFAIFLRFVALLQLHLFRESEIKYIKQQINKKQ